MDYFKQDKSEIFTFEVDESAKSTLMEMSRWTKFLAIVGFIFIGIMVFAGIILAFTLSRYAGVASSSPLGGIGSPGIMLLYVVFAAIYIYPTYALYKYSTGMKYAISQNDKPKFNQALTFLKNMFRYIGILMIVAICGYGLAIIAVIVFAAGKV